MRSDDKKLPSTHDGSKSLMQQARHQTKPDGSRCNARLFDSRWLWVECAIAGAVIVTKCWRCGALVGFTLHMAGRVMDE